jgi:hypothetical protein
MNWLSNFLKHIEADIKPVIAPIAEALAPSLEADIAQAISDQHLNVLKSVASGLDKAGVPEPFANIAMNLVGNALDQVQVKVVAAGAAFVDSQIGTQPAAPAAAAPPLVAALADKMAASGNAPLQPPPIGVEEGSPLPLASGDGGTAV